MKDKKQSDPLIIINFDTLTEVIKTLQMNNLRLMDEIKEVKERFIGIANHQVDIDNLKYKMEIVQSKITNSDDSIDQYAKKFLEIDTKFLSMNNIFNEAEDKRSKVDLEIKTINDKVTLHENSLNNLNRVVDGNAKAFEKEKERVSPLFTDQITLESRVQATEDRLKNISNVYDENIRRIEMMTEFMDNTSKENRHKVFKKLNDHEHKTNVVIDKVNILTENIMKINQNQSGHTNGNNQSNDSNNEEDDEDEDCVGVKTEKVMEEQLEYKTSPIKKSKSDNMQKINELIQSIEEIRNEYIQYKEDNEKEIKTLRELIELNENNYQSYIQQMEIETKERKDITLNIEPIEILQQQTQNQMEPDSVKAKKMLDTIRLIAASVEGKAPKDELNSLHKNLNKEMDKISSKLESIVLKFDSKFSLIANSVNGKNMDPEILAQQLNDQIKAVFNASAVEVIQNHISQIDFTPNDMIKETIKLTEQHSDELNKAYESLVEIRKNLLSKSIEENVINLLCRMDSIEKNQLSSAMDIANINKLIEGDPSNENDNEKKEGVDNDNQLNQEKKEEADKPSIRESLEVLNAKTEMAIERSDKVEKQQTEIHKNILLLIKQDLRNESKRIFDEFKVNLKSSLLRIEDQLREKVDKFNLNEFSQKLDSKFNHEIKHKIDQGDLNKNNMSINKKIDSLENKISKALVDTLIDLQIEEAPLLIKKNLKPFDRCASCNQIVTKKRNNHQSNIHSSSSYAQLVSSFDNNHNTSIHINTNHPVKIKQHKAGLKERLPDLRPLY